jgi:hypothetical protein
MCEEKTRWAARQRCGAIAIGSAHVLSIGNLWYDKEEMKVIMEQVEVKVEEQEEKEEAERGRVLCCSGL